jgi:hypothetical protein
MKIALHCERENSVVRIDSNSRKIIASGERSSVKEADHALKKENLSYQSIHYSLRLEEKLRFSFSQALSFEI